jgi:diguanylate cyclase (GGDEF)-like protein
MTRNASPVSKLESPSPPIAPGGAAVGEAGDAQARLLIVDDIAENRAILGRRFRRCGFHVTEADGGRRALELIRQQDFDLVLLDVMMPDLSGVEVLKGIRERQSPLMLPVIMVTAKSQSEDIVQALALGANDYVTKPVDFAVALARANTQLGRKRAEEAILAANAALSQANQELERRVDERTARLYEANRRLELEMVHRERSQAKIKYLAHYDALTGLPNRVLFREQLEEAFARSKQSGDTLAILFLDLDGFKSVNDTLGHSIGDALLRSIADRLRDSLGETDRIARLGGDEFAVVQLSGEQPGGAAALAGKLIELASRPCVIDDHQLEIGASVGIAVSVAGDADPEQLLKSADLAMYSAKADGRGRYRFFQPEMDAAARARRSLEMDLRAALGRGEIDLYYQPLVNLRTSQVCGFEALMRWKHPERGFVSPAEFVPASEEVGLIVQLGEWALRRACADAATWPGDIKVAVNLSPVQFKSGKIVPTVVSALAASGLAANRLELEITESVLMERSEANLAVLQQLRDLGVRICMDDFGTGYSSLSYLRSFRFDKIKIDQSFIGDMTKREESLAIMRAIAGLGISFGVSTTAEGVETQEQLGWVRTEGCTEAQGFLFSCARPAAEIPALIAFLNAGDGQGRAAG